MTSEPSPGGRAPPRLHVKAAFAVGAALRLPAAAARHVQVLRLQPGDAIALFDGGGDNGDVLRDGTDNGDVHRDGGDNGDVLRDGADNADVHRDGGDHGDVDRDSGGDDDGRGDREWPATIVRIGRDGVDVRLAEPVVVARELHFAVTLAVGVPAGDRMDAIVEKAGELGAARVAPLICARAVVRLSGERAQSRRRHWAGVAVAASEQCGRTRIAAIDEVRLFADWLAALPPADAAESRLVLSLSADAAALDRVFTGSGFLASDAAEAAVAHRYRPGRKSAGSPAAAREDRASRTAGGSPGDGIDRPTRASAGTAPGSRPRIVVLSGPEGGLTREEEEAAVERGFVRVGLGPRVLRADTAPIACLATLAFLLPRASRRP